MCDPKTASVLMMGSSGLAAGSQFVAGQQQARVNRLNARLAEDAGRDALQRGATAENRYKADMRQLQGRQRAVAAARGMEGGSIDDIIRDTGEIAAEDISTIRTNAAREAFGFKVQADSYRFQSRLDRRGGAFSAAGTLLGGAARTAEIWDRVRR